MIEYFLVPTKVDEPPRHTQMHPRCFTCSKFPVCNIRDDYLKSCLLIQNILGDPQEDDKLFYYNDDWIILPGFCGKNFTEEETEKYFPITINTTEGEEGIFMAAKYRAKDVVQFFYIINNYYVLFQAMWNKVNKIFDIPQGFEVFYGMKYTLSTEFINLLQENLKAWRDVQIEKEEKNKDIDIINTTHFSARLDCEFYEWEKGLTEQDGIRKLIKEFPDGIPCKDGSVYHLATYHVEPNKVPLYHPENGKVAFSPMPYPVFIPPKCKKKVITRKEQNNEI